MVQTSKIAQTITIMGFIEVLLLGLCRVRRLEALLELFDLLGCLLLCIEPGQIRRKYQYANMVWLGTMCFILYM
jgi:hypothetical protein